MFEGFAELPNLRLWYWDTGGTGQPIVMLHPASQSCQVWEHQRQAFSQAGYRVIAYSRRGVFKSDAGSLADTGSSVSDLVNLLDYLRVDQAHILGAAAGAITALGFAVGHQERVRSLVLAGTIFQPDEPDWRDYFGRLAIADVRGKVPTEFLELGPSYRIAESAGVLRFAELSREALASQPVKQPLGTKVNWEKIEQLTMPVLLLTGEADLFAPPPLQKMVANHMRRHRLETLQEVGHAPYWEAPYAFNSIVLDFLGSNS
ncbi:MAG: alpha/beta hydrolase [Pseudomonadota bacterium]